MRLRFTRILDTTQGQQLDSPGCLENGVSGIYPVLTQAPLGTVPQSIRSDVRRFSLLMHRGRVREADDRTHSGLKPSDCLSPGFGTCSWSSVKPFSLNSSAASWTVSALATSNSMLASGIGWSAGQSEVPKHAFAA